jgi:hypothetical protein
MPLREPVLGSFVRQGEHCHRQAFTSTIRELKDTASRKENVYGKMHVVCDLTREWGEIILTIWVGRRLA